MKLDVPIIYQKEESVECGLACLAMILNYYGKYVTVDDLTKEIKLYKLGTYSGQLGLYLLKNGFDVTIETMNPLVFTLKDKKISQKEILNRFKKLLKESRNASHRSGLRYFIKFIKAGGRIEPKIPSLADIEIELKNKRPLIAFLTSKFMSSDYPILNFHCNVIIGVANNQIIINDPLPDTSGGKKIYPICDFMFGVYASTIGDIDNGSLIKIKRNN